ncbi:lysophospholipid acyltransferase family protein, partial [Kocuria tytonicola]|uniref:lysophospholipid acyltransferase family protein n=1 Tax=Kocuria tytonicola TaxID=2055946 RepID=UPI001F0B87EE
PPPPPPAESAPLTAAHYTQPVRRIVRRIVQGVFFRGLVNRTITRTNVVDPAAYGVKGTCVVVANHSSHLDAPLVMSGVPRYISRDLATGVAADYFFTTWYKKFFTQLMFNAFPVDRRGEGANRGLSKKLLAAGVPLLLFPEGTRSKTGKMARFQVGAASLALSTQVPVVPVALIGAHEAMPRGANWPRPGRPPVVVAVGAPLRTRGNEKADAFNERVEAAVRALYAANRYRIQD